MLMRILDRLETPTIAVLRDSQNYVHAAAHGLGIYEMPHHQVKQDTEQMDRIVDWLDQQLIRTMKPGLMARLNPLTKLFTSSAPEVVHSE